MTKGCEVTSLQQSVHPFLIQSKSPPKTPQEPTKLKDFVWAAFSQKGSLNQSTSPFHVPKHLENIQLLLSESYPQVLATLAPATRQLMVWWTILPGVLLGDMRMGMVEP